MTIVAWALDHPTYFGWHVRSSEAALGAAFRQLSSLNSVHAAILANVADLDSTPSPGTSRVDPGGRRQQVRLRRPGGNLLYPT